MSINLELDNVKEKYSILLIKEIKRRVLVCKKHQLANKYRIHYLYYPRSWRQCRFK